ncbi:hypothetical protein BGZ98_005322 [Dissophora globulifera]|nr:hypothetical protein BGZ98_005322 [Dissophora globulifera]
MNTAAWTGCKERWDGAESSSEYWKSNAKHWCRFCKIYITDNKATKNIHDNGTKHKENVERFLREQNQRGKDKEADTARMNKQMDAIEKAALKQYQLDVEAGLVQPSASSPAPTKVLSAHSERSAPLSISAAPGVPASKPTTGAPSSSSDSTSGAAVTVAAAADATGSNSEPVVAKTPAAPIPITIRNESVGQPGEWQTVEVPAPRPTNRRDGGEANTKKDEDGSHYVPGADDDDEEADPEDLRGFKIVEKTYPVEPELPGEDGEDAGAAVFKKRKAGASKPRNIRRKL